MATENVQATLWFPLIVEYKEAPPSPPRLVNAWGTCKLHHPCAFLHKALVIDKCRTNNNNSSSMYSSTVAQP